VAGQYPLARGFDHAYGLLNAAVDYFKHTAGSGRPDWYRNGKPVVEEGYATDLIADEAIRFIDNRDKSRPFFLYVPFNAVHTPLQAKPELLEKYARIPDMKRRTYAAMLDAMDTAAGRILRKLDDDRIAENTIVLFTSDNGGQPAQGGKNLFRGGKGTTWEGGIRVPAVLRWRGRLKPAGSSQVLSLLDVFPTLAGAAGVPPANTLPLDGRNLWDAIRRGVPQAREDLLFAVDYTVSAQQYAVRRGDWKLVRLTGDGEPRNSLFKLDEDPQERTDLASKNQALVEQLTAVIEKWASLHPPGGDRRAMEAAARERQAKQP
jgi:arylsulfatase A-like enzyme